MCIVLYTEHWSDSGTLASNLQNTSSPKYNDDISLLISQYLISAWDRHQGDTNELLMQTDTKDRQTPIIKDRYFRGRQTSRIDEH